MKNFSVLVLLSCVASLALGCGLPSVAAPEQPRPIRVFPSDWCKHQGPDGKCMDKWEK